MGEHSGLIIGLIIGLGIIGLGVGARLGSFKTMYLTKGINGVYPSYVYGLIPLGLGFVTYAFVSLQNQTLARNIGLCLLLISLLLPIWQPRWLKPWWLKWLEDNYGHILEVLLGEARNTWSFKNQPHTQADLEEWVEEVRRKHGL